MSRTTPPSGTAVSYLLGAGHIFPDGYVTAIEVTIVIGNDRAVGIMAAELSVAAACCRTHTCRRKLPDAAKSITARIATKKPGTRFIALRTTRTAGTLCLQDIDLTATILRARREMSTGRLENQRPIVLLADVVRLQFARRRATGNPVTETPVPVEENL